MKVVKSLDIVNDYIEKLEQENKQLKEKLKEVKKILLCGFDTQATIFKALEILECKEQPKVITNEDMGIKLDELKNQFNDAWEYGDR